VACARSARRSYAGSPVSFGFFFFFQAEDGIRARNVTGVQTCALPISRVVAAATRVATWTSTATACGCGAACGCGREGRAQLRRQIGRASCREREQAPGGGGRTKDERHVIARGEGSARDRRHSQHLE